MAEETETAAGDADAEEAQAAEAEQDHNRDSVIAALRRERAGYVQRGMNDRVSEVDASLKQLGAKAEARESRTSGAPRERAVESKPRTTAGGRPRGKS